MSDQSRRSCNEISRMSWRRFSTRRKFRVAAYSDFTQAHILVHPSRHEALGITFLEALSCGLAIITTSGPGMENVGEIIEDGVGGTLVRKLSVHEDPPVDAVFDAVTALLDDPDRYDAMSRHNLSLVQDGPFSLSDGATRCC